MSVTERWRGPDSFRTLLVSVEDLRTHPENPRRGVVWTIAASLKAFGQLKPCVVRDLDGQATIYAGNHTYLAARELGWTHVAATRIDHLSEEEAEKYLLMDNRASDGATYDYDVLIPNLEELAGRGAIERAGYTSGELEEFRREARELSDAALRDFEAARDEEPEPGPAAEGPRPLVRQVLLAMSPDEFEPFAKKLLVLRRHYGAADVSATVAEAVARTFRAVWGERPEPAPEPEPPDA